MKRKCAYVNCDREATDYALGRDKPYTKVKKYCEAHTEVICDQGNPEYTVDCPKCGCRFGVN